MTYSLPGNFFSKSNAGYVNIGFLLLVLTMLFPFPASALNKGSDKASSSGLDYQIGRWRGFKKAAFTISFDDNYRFQVTYAAPLLDQHNYKATYFIVTNRVGKGYAPGWDTLNMLASEGYEIASHSKNHADFVTLSQHPEWADSMIHEFRDSRDTINARVPSQQCETFAWPNGSVDSADIDVGKNYYMACRGTENECNGPDPINFYNIYSQHIYHDTPLEEVNGFIDTILSRKGWLVERWHGFRVMHDTNGYEPVPIQEFAAHLDHVAQNEKNLWITTLDSVIKYIRERDTSALSLVDSTGFRVLFSLTNNLPEILFHYHVPLSLKVRIYGKMASVYLITQGNNTLPFSIAMQYGVNYLHFDAVPNDSLIELHLPDPFWTHDPMALNNGAVNYPNPFTSATTVLFDLPEAENIDIRFYNQIGRQLRNYSNFYPAGRNSLKFDGSGLAPGIYNCFIRTRERTMHVRMLMTR